MRLHRLTLCCVFFTSALFVAQADVFSPNQTERLIKFVENLLQCRKVTGLTLAVVRNNVTWTRGFGLADVESGRKVNSSTLFAIGSVSKAFTSAMLSLYINQSSRYSWKTPIADILGDDFRFTNDELTRHLTLKDVLTHRTGLQATNVPLFANLPEGMTRADYARRFRYLPVSAPFRDQFNYNNWLYGLAGRVAEVMGGATWEEILQKRLLEPLRMKDTRVLGQTVTVKADNFAKPYVEVGEDIVPSDPSIYSISPQEAAGAIASSADDMAKWLLLQLNKGQTQEGVALLNDTRMREMFSPHVSVPPDFTSRANLWKPVYPAAYTTYGYGYGWMVASYKGYQVIWHSGGLYAYITYLALVPDINLGFFVSTNGPGNANSSQIVRQLFFYIADLGLEEEPWLDISNACDFPGHWVNATERQPLNNTRVDGTGDFNNAENFAGLYGHLLFGDVEVSLNGSKGLTVKYNRLEGKLYRSVNADNVALLELLGRLAFLSQKVNSTSYVNFTFTNRDGSGKFQNLDVSAPDMGETEVIVFKRGIKFSDPVSDVASGEQVFTVQSLICLLVAVCWSVFNTRSGC